MSETDRPETAGSSPARVLVLVSSADELVLRGGRRESTGIYLSELTDPTDEMLKAGFELTFTTPGGRVPTIDGASVSLMYFRGSRARRNAAFRSYTRLLEMGLGSPVPLEEIATDRDRLRQFDGLFIPGGHAPLTDLLYRDALSGDEPNEDLGALLAFFHETSRPTGLICHAPLALGSAPETGDRWIYEGYRMTTFRTLVDRLLEAIPIGRRFRGRLPHYPAELLAGKGARVEHTVLPMGRKVVEDRELITGQDPFSGPALGRAFVAKVNRGQTG